jgi:hypothetical protein
MPRSLYHPQHWFEKVITMKPFVLSVAVLVAFSLILSACQQPSGMSAAARATYMQRGDSLTRISFDTLRNTLLRSILRDGPAGAVVFCKAEAGTLTGAYASDEVVISRTSLRFRNPGNRPDSLAETVLRAMQDSIDQGVVARPFLQETPDGMVHYYKPILVQAMCLNCHGSVPGQVQPDVLAKIDSLYPGDLARNYQEGQLRGAWHVRFARKAGQ